MSQQRVVPFLTFHGNAESALDYYARVIPGAKARVLHRYEQGMPGELGKVMVGMLTIGGEDIQFMDLNHQHELPAFTWSTSLLVYFADEADWSAAFNGFADGGTVMMQEDNFMQFRKVAWVTDKFGVTWQPILK